MSAQDNSTDSNVLKPDLGNAEAFRVVDTLVEAHHDR